MLQPNPRYMAQQEFINIKMRSILIDWLVQVHLRFSMQTETLYLTISIIDRFLAVRQQAAHRIKDTLGPLILSFIQRSPNFKAKPLIKDTLKEDKPHHKGQANSTLVYTLHRKSPLKEDNLSSYKGQNGWPRRCPH